MNLIMLILSALLPRFALNTFTQSGIPDAQGLQLTFVKDTTAWRAAKGYTGTASDLLVAPYMGGYIWIASGSPNAVVYSLTAADQAFDTATGKWYRSGTAASATWYCTALS